MNPRSCVNIHKEWDIVGARQLGREMAKEIGFGTVDQARIATAVSELARNIYLYAKNGQVCFEYIYTNSQKGILMTAVDTGPGIKDISRVMQDGYTTSGGLGAGLPGVKRLMDEFDIESAAGEGTKIKAIKWIR
ncbi:serine/threonine-protein kinase RsbT [Oceanobacillus oncorhynchi subsp. incaldanensis]|uniref:Serine/threonine-protein kinase RsbT n=2 Tax=Oceanobacillus TaxID=182709 RepID=A0A0A1MSG7_9BACI|nr:anti-sigma regulatory factor [Oceanobacillus oncorhynchi]MDM8102651.1 anti-sigma regulatory factor [Oceanobacillus oncorhynchi]UUI41079.1 anti-sigma regulatory factor [Oceanobacillus oncorhynchi]GIO21329.1 serine/threonine-protein kinase RsbT [Oceanobacillus oncorhynchi subsp. incaldanensis]CEI82532.1 Serine/threonine-protein kinase RsbT [Oceanobacillus oncorhynchi]